MEGKGAKDEADQDKLQKLIPQFELVSFTHIPREQNRFADALATLASMIEIPMGVKVRPLLIEQKDTPNYYTVDAISEEFDGLPWFTDIKNYIGKGEYPEGADEKDKRAICRLAAQFSSFSMRTIYTDGRMMAFNKDALIETREKG